MLRAQKMPPPAGMGGDGYWVGVFCRQENQSILTKIALTTKMAWAAAERTPTSSFSRKIETPIRKVAASSANAYPMIINVTTPYRTNTK